MDYLQQSLMILGGVLLFCSAWLVHHFASVSVSVLIKLLAICSFALGFGGIALLPVDLTITERYDDSEVDPTTIEPNATFLPWMVTYWSTFFLAWTVLPLFRESLLSEQFTFCTRLTAGCRKAMRGYIILLAVAISAILVLAFKMHSWHVIPVLMALGNTYGLLLVSLLLGYGLIDVPRLLWRKANVKHELRRTRIMASNADEAVFDAVWELQDCEVLVDEVAVKAGDASSNTDGERTTMTTQYASCLDKLLTLRKSTAMLSPELQRRRTGGHEKRHEENGDINGTAETDYQADGLPSLEYLARLNARLESAIAGVISAEQRWNSLLKTNQLYADLAEGTVPRPTRALSEPTDSFCMRCGARFESVTTCFRYVWLVALRNTFYRLLGFSCAILSGVVLWSEATLAAPFNLSPFAIALEMFDKGSRGILFQLAAMVPLLYMSVCVYSSLFKLSLFGRYRLRGIHQSQGVALVFNAQYLVRLQFPLGYNYLYLIKYDTTTTSCAFSHVMSDMKTVPFFGTSFSVYAPLLILALCAFTLCNGYARLLAMLGIDHEDAILLSDPQTLDGKVNEGITLLERHSSRRNNGSPPPKLDEDRRASRKGLLKGSGSKRSDSSSRIEMV